MSTQSHHSDACEWFAGWYATRLHAVFGPMPAPQQSPVQSACGAWVYPHAKTKRAKRRIEMGCPKCRHCQRLVMKKLGGAEGGAQ